MDSGIKLVVLVKRNAGIDFAEFQSFYENVHSRLIRHLPDAKRYFRRYLHPLGGEPMNADNSAYDLIAELWFDSRAELDTSMRILANPEIHRADAAEEARLIDHSATRLYIVDEHHSDLTADIPVAG